jgi:hypothetical protein
MPAGGTIKHKNIRVGVQPPLDGSIFRVVNMPPWGTIKHENTG